MSLLVSIIVTQTLQSDGKKDVAKKLNRKLALGALVGAVVIYAALTVVMAG